MKNLIVLTVGLLSMTAQAGEQSDAFKKLWNQYVHQEEKYSLQEGCKPDWIHADSKVPFRGTIILHHGFTACSQQYQEWANDYLAKNGYDVLLTVLPGHGRTWQGEKLDQNDLTGVPTRETWRAVYSKFIRNTNAIMKEAAGEHVLGGLSVGGVVAAEAMLQDPSIYQRVILFSPFFSISKVTAESEEMNWWVKSVQTVSGPLNAKKAELVDWLSTPGSPQEYFSKRRQSWGDECEKTERNGGRAGYCQFYLNFISADQMLGEKVMAETARTKALPQIQILAVERDPTASTTDIRKFANLVRRSSEVKPNVCFFKSDTNHSLLSRFDSPKQNKYWLPFLLKESTDFVVNGKAVDTHGIDATEGKFPACAI